MRLYTNENFPRQAVEELRALGHDVLTSHEAGNANRAIPDDAVLRFATEQDRVVVSLNRKDFIQLHAKSVEHAGIVVCTVDTNYRALAERIHAQLSSALSLAGTLYRVTRETPVTVI